MARARGALPLCVLAAVVSACGGSSVGPPPPPSGPTVPAAPLGLRVVTLDSAARTAVIQWNPSQDADRYVAEYWNTFDSSVTITSVPTAGTETTTTLRDLPGTWLSVRVRAGNSAGFSAPSVPVSLQIPVQKDIVEALFFGSGPYGSGLNFQPSLDGAGLFARPPAVDYMQIAGNGMHLSPGLMLA